MNSLPLSAVPLGLLSGAIYDSTEEIVKYYNTNPTVFKITVIFFFFLSLVLLIILITVRQYLIDNKIQKAEEKAYGVDPEEKKSPVSLHALFNLYSKQIEKYQQETRTRASLSFFFAILSMCAGMGFMFWGGSFILADPSANHVAAGAAISAIGGGISAYITKTFLDVHKLSLTQLNRYFTQPVINDR